MVYVALLANERQSESKTGGTAQQEFEMRILLILWFVPVALLGVWYGLSVNDWHMGTRIFSRELHDLVFGLYGKLLGMQPEELPPVLARAIALDSLVVFAIVAFRMRARWWPTVKSYLRPELPVTGQGSPAE